MKKLITVLVSTLLLPLGAQAFPLLDAIQTKLPHSKAPLRTDCTNFSGNWKGSCVIDGKSAANSTSITQLGCELLSSDGSGTSVGGLSSVNLMAPISKDVTLGLALTQASNWNQDRTAIHSTYTGNVQVPQAGGVAIQGNSTLQMNGERLAFDASILGVAVSCVYDKQ